MSCQDLSRSPGTTGQNDRAKYTATPDVFLRGDRQSVRTSHAEKRCGWLSPFRRRNLDKFLIPRSKKEKEENNSTTRAPGKGSLHGCSGSSCEGPPWMSTSFTRRVSLLLPFLAVLPVRRSASTKVGGATTATAATAKDISPTRRGRPRAASPCTTWSTPSRSLTSRLSV